jgi:hypothetical protein
MMQMETMNVTAMEIIEMGMHETEAGSEVGDPVIHYPRYTPAAPLNHAQTPNI